MNKILIALIFFFVACSKDSDQVQNTYGCEYGVNKTTGEREFINCVPEEVYGVYTNQDQVNKICDKLGIDRIDVSGLANYTNLEWKQNPNCDCQ